jgi:hypothetical protein
MLEQASLYRGAGTPLYMSQEQKRNEPPDPRHDLYSLGVLWYQLLVGDVTRELHPNWAKELEVKFATPPDHVAVMQRCVGWFEERARDAGELLTQLRPLVASSPPAPQRDAPAANSGLDERFRSAVLRANLTTLQKCHEKVELEMKGEGAIVGGILGGFFGGGLGGLGLWGFLYASFTKPDYYDRLFHWYVPEPVDYLLAILFGIGIFCGCLMLASRARHRGAERAQRELTVKIAEMAEAFPAAVQAWGGSVVLYDAIVVRELLRVLQEETK